MDLYALELFYDAPLLNDLPAADDQKYLHKIVILMIHGFCSAVLSYKNLSKIRRFLTNETEFFSFEESLKYLKIM